MKDEKIEMTPERVDEIEKLASSLKDSRSLPALIQDLWEIAQELCISLRGARVERDNLALQIKHPLGGFCSYCGHHFEVSSEVSEEARAKVVDHMTVCEQAPYGRMACEMIRLRARNARLRFALSKIHDERVIHRSVHNVREHAYAALAADALEEERGEG
jgi:hypothetical protein